MFSMSGIIVSYLADGFSTSENSFGSGFYILYFEFIFLKLSEQVWLYDCVVKNEHTSDQGYYN